MTSDAHPQNAIASDGEVVGGSHQVIIIIPLFYLRSFSHSFTLLRFSRVSHSGLIFVSLINSRHAICVVSRCLQNKTQMQYCSIYLQDTSKNKIYCFPVSITTKLLRMPLHVYQHVLFKTSSKIEQIHFCHHTPQK